MNCTNFAIFCEQCPWSPSIQKLLLTSTGIQHCSTMLNPTNQAAKQSSNRCVDVGFRFFLRLSHSKISILSHSKPIYIQCIYIYTFGPISDQIWPGVGCSEKTTTRTSSDGHWIYLLMCVARIMSSTSLQETPGTLEYPG